MVGVLGGSVPKKQERDKKRAAFIVFFSRLGQSRYAAHRFADMSTLKLERKAMALQIEGKFGAFGS